MKIKTPCLEESPKSGDQPTSRAPFCLRLNTLRALASISVIFTHIVGYFGFRRQFRSLWYSGHMAVYFFFALSGYLLSLSLIKEIRRRMKLDKKQGESRPTQDPEALPFRIEIDGTEQNEDQDSKEFSPQVKDKRLKSSARSLFGLDEFVMFSVLGKYLWNRTIRLFPLYYGCWALLKFFARQDVEDLTPGALMIGYLWKDIFLLKIFPEHLWTMRIEMMFYYYVIPVFIVCLCIAFYLQKKGLKLASTIFLSLMVCVLLFVALDKMNLEEDITRPLKSKNFRDHLPPFFFGMLAALVNFALEQEINSQQAAKVNVPQEEESLENSRDLKSRLSKAASSLFNKYKWNIVFLAVFLRIVMLNPGVYKSLWTATDEVPKWQMTNLNSYWYAIFILINDTRGGFWQVMHSKSQPQPSPSQLPFFSKIFYYFGLWSYPIYLTHPISFVTLSHYFPEFKNSVEIVPLSLICCFALGGLADFVIDKILVNKLILGKCLRFESRNN